MKQGIVIVFCLSALIISSCRDRNSNNTKGKIPDFLLGYWIPQQIKWEIEDPRYKDSSRMFQTAHFRTLCFDTINRFIYLGATQRHQNVDNDSIIFAGEPLVTVFAGTWKTVNDTVLMVDYKPVEWEINPPDKTEKSQQIKILFEKDTLLLFDNKIYVRTLKYDVKSQQTIEGYKKQYIK